MIGHEATGYRGLLSSFREVKKLGQPRPTLSKEEKSSGPFSEVELLGLRPTKPNMCSR